MDTSKTASALMPHPNGSAKTQESLRSYLPAFIGNFEGFENHIFMPFLTICSMSRTTIRVSGIHTAFAQNSQLYSLIGHASTALEKHHLLIKEPTDQEIANTLRLIGCWTNLHIGDYYYARQHTTTTIMENCSNLEVLDMHTSDEVPATSLQSVLSRARKLRSSGWIGSYSSQHPRSSEEIRGRHLVWRFLDNPIKMPRPDSHVPEICHNSHWTTISTETSYEVQRKVY